MNRDTIKLIAIITMCINHTAHIFLEPDTILYEILIDIGYFTAITMCYFLVEGYTYTRSKITYLQRLLLFAVISQVPYSLALNTNKLNMLFTLSICFLILIVIDKISNIPLKILTVVILAAITYFCDWSIKAALFTVMFSFSKGSKNKMITAYIIAFVIFTVESTINYCTLYPLYLAAIHGIMSGTGVIVSGFIILKFYNGKKAIRFSNLLKWFFYMFYPLHLMVLYLIRSCYL